MKLETNAGLIEISPENKTEASLLSLWQAEVIRVLENEGTHLDVLSDLLQVNTYIEEDEP